MPTSNFPVLPKAMRATPLPVEETKPPTVVTDPDYLDSVAPVEVFRHETAEELQQERDAVRKAAERGLAHDCRVYYDANLSPQEMVEIISLRRGDAFSKEKIRTVIDQFLEQQKAKTGGNTK